MYVQVIVSCMWVLENEKKKKKHSSGIGMKLNKCNQKAHHKKNHARHSF